MQNKMYMTARVKEFDADERTIVAVASSGKVDRHNEVVRASGWDVKEYMTNPILLTNHNANDVLRSTIGRILWVKRIKGELVFKAYLGKTGAGAEAYDMISDLGLAAFSVGFRELQSKQMFVSELEGRELESAKEVGLKTGDRVSVITKAKLFEISLVSLPADQYALMKGNYEPTEMVRAGFGGLIKTKNLQDAYKDINFCEYMPKGQIHSGTIHQDEIKDEDEIIPPVVAEEDVITVSQEVLNEMIDERLASQDTEEYVEVDMSDEYVEIDLEEIKLSLRRALEAEMETVDIDTIVKSKLARITGKVL